MKLDVGVGCSFGRADEAERLEMVACSDTRFEKQPPRADKSLSEKRGVGIKRDRFQAFVLKVSFQMVLQIFSDGGQGMEAGDVRIFQVAGVANA